VGVAEDRDEVLRFLKNSVPRPFRMLLDLRLSMSACAATATAAAGRLHRVLSLDVHGALRAERVGPGAHQGGLSRVNSPPSNPSSASTPTPTGTSAKTWDLFGIRFDGHPHLERILLPRYWQGHPGRKEYSARATEFDPYLLTAARRTRSRPRSSSTPKTGA
jgi:NADH-quinone oxidoreductase subunit C/D